MNSQLKDRLERAVAERVFPGCALGIVQKNSEREIIAVGRQTYDPNSPAVTENTIFDIASVTKSVAGSSALLKLIDEKKLSLEDKIADLIPEFGNHENKCRATIRHVLTYTLDFEIEKMSSLKNLPPEEIIKTVVTAKFKNPPGTTYKYANATALLIHLIVEKITSKKLDTFVEDEFFKPLGMMRTTFHPKKFPKPEIAPTEIDDWRGGEVRGVVHDESSFALHAKSAVAVAGLFSTVPDTLTFEHMLLNGGELNGKKYFLKSTVKAMHTNQIPEIGSAGLGWELDQEFFMGLKRSHQAFGKTGFTGCSLVIDPERGIGFALLSNRTYPKRPADSSATSAINAVRRDIADMIYMWYK